MLEAIASGILSTLTSLIMSYTIDGASKIKIQDAPSWYMQQDSDEKIYSYSYLEEGKGSIEKAKESAKKEMINKISTLQNQAIKAYFPAITNSSDIEFLQKAGRDNSLESFISKTIQYENIEQRDARQEGTFSNVRPNQIFIRASMAKKVVIQYEKLRLYKLSAELSKQRANDAESEMDNSLDEY